MTKFPLVPTSPVIKDVNVTTNVINSDVFVEFTRCRIGEVPSLHKIPMHKNDGAYEAVTNLGFNFELKFSLVPHVGLTPILTIEGWDKSESYYCNDEGLRLKFYEKFQEFLKD